MQSLVKKLKDRQNFEEETLRRRKEEIAVLRNSDIPPVFNKRHFSAKGSVVITQASRDIMAINAENFTETDEYSLTKHELSVMRNVVDGLKLIHRGLDHVKDVLSHVITIETYEPFSHVAEKDHEDSMSCYYIIYGAVEVTYDAITCSNSAVQVFEPNIVYTNGTGEYVGLVSVDGKANDMTSPSSIYTKEHSMFVRVDRQAFHRHLAKTRNQLEEEKWTFINMESGPMLFLSPIEKSKMVAAFTKVEFGPNKVLLKQDERSDVLFIILEGQCKCVRQLYLEDAMEYCIVQTGSLHPGDIAGFEIVDNPLRLYVSTVYTTTRTTCFRFHRHDLEALNKKQFEMVKERHPVEDVDDVTLMSKGYKTTSWKRYKDHQVTLAISKNQEVPPLQLPIDSKWGTTTEKEIKRRLFIEFLKGKAPPEPKRPQRCASAHASLQSTGSDPIERRTISIKPLSARNSSSREPTHLRLMQQRKSAPCLRSIRLVTPDPASYSEADITAQEAKAKLEDEANPTDRASFRSLGARDIVRQAKEAAEAKSRKRVSMVPDGNAREQSYYSNIRITYQLSTAHCAISREKLEFMKRKLDRLTHMRRQMEEERMRRTREREFKMALRGHKMPTKSVVII